MELSQPGEEAIFLFYSFRAQGVSLARAYGIRPDCSSFVSNPLFVDVSVFNPLMEEAHQSFSVQY